MMNRQTGYIPQTLSSFQRKVYVLSIFLIIISAFEICFFSAGYIGLAVIKIKTGLWYLWSFLGAIFRLITPISFIIAISCTIYFYSRLCRQGKNCKPAIIAAIATGTSLLSLLSISATDKLFHKFVINTYGNIKIEQKNWTGEALPDFTFQNIQENLAPLTIENLQGRTSILIFWATYNKTWSSNFRYAQELYNQKEKLNINVFAIAIDKSRDDVKKFLEKHTVRMPIFHNPDATYVYNQLGLMRSPEKVIILDSMTRIQFIFDSPDTADEIKTALNKIQ
ncbi:MAG TPA: redoxin domain-containing protein [Thermodesulfovibrionales bacterium]|nr:redoxin domain-containing protein [Thermodesulfovibrionales bacterium]